MKTKIIPFDLETAKKIQAEEIEGKIKTRDGAYVRIICWDAYRKFNDNEIIALVKDDDLDEAIGRYRRDGHLVGARNISNDLVLEVPDNEPQFKPFDKVLVYNRQNGKWFPTFFSHIASDGRIITITNGFYDRDEVVDYEGNEHLVGITDKPKEK